MFDIEKIIKMKKSDQREVINLMVGYIQKLEVYKENIDRKITDFKNSTDAMVCFDRAIDTNNKNLNEAYYGEDNESCKGIGPIGKSAIEEAGRVAKKKLTIYDVNRMQVESMTEEFVKNFNPEDYKTE